MARCGSNVINVHVPSVLEALVVEFMDFTKVVASMGTWAYMVYSAANLGLVWFCITFGSGTYKALCITLPAQKENARLAQLEASCEVLRNGEWVKITASEVVLGDIVRADDAGEAKLPCDGLVIDGSIVTQESMLTGEPMPIQKSPVEDNDEPLTKKNRAFAGTNCLQSVGPKDGKAVMIATAVGALTTRGQLVRMVLFPTSVRFKYIDQLPTVYALLFVYMLILVFIYVCYVDVGGWVATYLLVVNTCAMCLNPMLPVSMIMGQAASAGRLKRELKINCLQPGRIAVAGKISNMVFDKTGTITKEGMDFSGVVPVQDGVCAEEIAFDTGDVECMKNRDTIANKVPDVLRHALASCHTVSKMRDGMLIGNAVEVSMVKACGWDLSESVITSPSKSETLEVVKKLEFDHHRMTSGVVVRWQETGELKVYVKGSYEKIESISRQVPPDYKARTNFYAKRGNYTLGLATKTLSSSLSNDDIIAMSRNSLEDGLIVCGLLLFINEMKNDSPDAMLALEKGGIRSVICTGDNALTGISIGKQCGIVKTDTVLLGELIGERLVWKDSDTEQETDVFEHDCQLAVAQGAWRYLHSNPAELDRIWMRIMVFARMKPEDKINVVKYFQSRNLVVGMAGDGGNDCGGLRAAHAGLALSDAEASMVSPFSSGREGKRGAPKTLMTVVDMIREGRACLSTNLATFQFYMVYGIVLTLIRTFLALYGSLSLGEFVWLTNDIVFGITMVSFMVGSKPTAQLSSYRPTATLLGIRAVVSILFPVLTAIIFMGVSYASLWSQNWYLFLNPLHDISIPGEKWMLKGDNYDSSIGALFLFTVLSTTAFVNTYGGTFRRNILYNVPVMVCYLVVLVGITVLTLADPSQFSCLYRVNCDTHQSLESKDLTIFKWFSKLGGAGLVGGCFLGPVLKTWQPQLTKFSESWQRDATSQCLPPAAVQPGFHDMDFGCDGPNNCYSGQFRTELFIILAVYVLLNHAFVKFVLQGFVAGYLREKQSRRDAQKRTNQVDGSHADGTNGDKKEVDNADSCIDGADVKEIQL
jgi:cation-transporting ATPase 13A3/4/5